VHGEENLRTRERDEAFQPGDDEKALKIANNKKHNYVL